MRVRVHDAASGGFFQSELYAVFFSGIFERCLVLRDGQLSLVDACRGEGSGYRSLINRIDPAEPPEWLHLTNGALTDFPDFPKHLSEDRWPAFRGYAWVWADRATLRRLLQGETVPLGDAQFAAQRLSSRLPGWTYVTTQAEADELLDQACGFHDSVLADLRYVSGSRLHPDGSLTACDAVRQVSMCFHSQWRPPLELVFEGVEGLDLRPAGDDVFSVIYGASVHVRDAAVFFCDGDCELEQEAAYSGTKILAYSLRWRFLPPLFSSTTSK